MSGRQAGPPEGKEGREMGRNENFIAVISVSSFYDMHGRRGRGKYGGELGKGWLQGKKWRREGGSPINKRGRKDWGARLLLQRTAARRGGRKKALNCRRCKFGKGGRNDAAAILGFFFI